MRRDLQSVPFLVGSVVFGWSLLIFSDVQTYLNKPTPGLGHPLITRTALVSVLLWGLASVGMLRLTPTEWADGSPRRAFVRLLWALGWATMVVHTAAAFHIGHGWSHASAYRHTEATAGVGEGIFVNYLFVLAWGADAAWFVGFPASYFRRPRRVGWAVHGFLAFVTFNATVVYGSGVARWMGVVLFALLGWFMVWQWQGGDGRLVRPKGASGNSQG
jgi:hypothetical protein